MCSLWTSPTFTLYLCFLITYIVVFSVFFSGSIGVYTLSFISNLLLNLI